MSRVYFDLVQSLSKLSNCRQNKKKLNLLAPNQNDRFRRFLLTFLRRCCLRTDNMFSIGFLPQLVFVIYTFNYDSYKRIRCGRYGIFTRYQFTKNCPIFRSFVYNSSGVAKQYRITFKGLYIIIINRQGWLSLDAFMAPYNTITRNRGPELTSQKVNRF